MQISPEEMRLRDIAIGLQASLEEANYRLKIAESAKALLIGEIQVLNNRMQIQEDALKVSNTITERLRLEVVLRNEEIIAIRHSSTWRVGDALVRPLRWVKRLIN